MAYLHMQIGPNKLLISVNLKEPYIGMVNIPYHISQSFF
jgi:hypothetical protein